MIKESGVYMENKEEILKKIDKLLALAGNNPSENEAISAALKAQALMAKYNIELADVQGAEYGQEIKKEIYTPKKSSHYVSKWKYSLSQIIAKNFCCKTYSLGRDAIVFYIHCPAPCVLQILSWSLKAMRVWE